MYTKPKGTENEKTLIFLILVAIMLFLVGCGGKGDTPDVNDDTPGVNDDTPVEHFHSGGTNTCLNGAICTACGMEYGTALGHDFAGDYLTATADVCYIDSVTITLKKDDGIAPVINYAGGTELFTSAGKPFVLDATAYDEGEGRDIPLVFEWSESAIDSDGLLVKGEHTVRVCATDHYGNTSELVLTVTVGDIDTLPPSINVVTSDVYVMAGTLYRFSLIATDNYDNVTVAQEWSAGAVDMYGVLQMGEHTLTLTATDLTGNVTVHTVTFHVVDSITDEFIIDCTAA